MIGPVPNPTAENAERLRSCHSLAHRFVPVQPIEADEPMGAKCQACQGIVSPAAALWYDQGVAAGLKLAVAAAKNRRAQPADGGECYP